MKGLGRKVSFLAIMAVIATAAMGAGYTLWYEDLELNANIDTGVLDAKIKCGSFGDNDGILVGGVVKFEHDIFGYPSPDPLKDVGTVDGEQGADNHEYVLTISNAYPGYAADCEVELLNFAGGGGSVAWHIETMTIELDAPGTEDDVIVDCADDPLNDLCILGEVGPTDPDADPIYVEMEQIVGCQVHNKISSSMIIGVNQSALENAHYTIKLKFQVNQWNESGWYGCGDDNPDRDGPVLPVQSVPNPL